MCYTTCIGELRRKMACEKHLTAGSFFEGAIPTHPSVANQECRSGRSSGSRRRGRANRAAVAACSAAEAASVSAAVSWSAEVRADGAAEIHHDDGRVAQRRLHGAEIDDLLVGDGGCRRRSVALLDCGELRREVSRRYRRSQPGRRRRRRGSVEFIARAAPNHCRRRCRGRRRKSGHRRHPLRLELSRPTSNLRRQFVVAERRKDVGNVCRRGGDRRNRGRSHVVEIDEKGVGRQEAKSDGAGKAAVRRKHVTPHMHALSGKFYLVLAARIKDLAPLWGLRDKNIFNANAEGLSHSDAC